MIPSGIVMKSSFKGVRPNIKIKRGAVLGCSTKNSWYFFRFLLRSSDINEEAPLPTAYPPISPTMHPKLAIKATTIGMKRFNCKKGKELKHTTKV